MASSGTQSRGKWSRGTGGRRLLANKNTPVSEKQWRKESVLHRQHRKTLPENRGRVVLNALNGCERLPHEAPAVTASGNRHKNRKSETKQ
jgi:hypothetical protein